MTDKTPTPFSNQCDILGQFWIEYKNDTEFADFIEYNDLGLPLAYAVASEIVTPNDKTPLFISETWDLLLAGLGIEDNNYESLADIFDAVDTK